ncbi:ATPase [Labrys okinawensis]|uniref:ATPase n=1 Tax=Labrys okinawensis TaxID=346911 RepID=A0A2S9Q583_9HYPH|nr:AAA family ATPase [Labrys okinawensis]PRH84523.1 ATPase [Labrys okinawensis]
MSFSVRDIWFKGYRSLRSIHFEVGDLSVFVGANGTGKTNLYRGLQLIQAAAQGSFAYELAREGGLAAALWAGLRPKNEPARIHLDVGLISDSARYRYRIEAGLVQQSGGAILGNGFLGEPQVKVETLKFSHGGRERTVLERKGPAVSIAGPDGKRRPFGVPLLASETALATLHDADRLADLAAVRRALLEWRFYHGLRTDRDSALRRPCYALATPTLASDGHDLAAVFATLVHIRADSETLFESVDEAFPGARLVVPMPDRMASFGMTFPDNPKRVYEASELSDGTLRYLALAGALLSARLPPFIALNEPEASLHPDLLVPLAGMIVRASRRAQIWLVTHSQVLADAIQDLSGVAPHRVIKRDGETWLEGLRLSGDFAGDD